ncbi:MAG: hypothetical protein ACLQVF_27550 [Isosphaeraceae bacterium]
MPNVERDVVKPPNQQGPAGNRAANGFMPLARDPSPTKPSNEPGAAGDRRGGSANLAGQMSPVKTPDHRFKLEDAKMPQPPAAFEPGKGAVPVIPFVPGGQGVNRVHPEAHMANPMK